MSIDEVRSNPPTAKYTPDRVREITILIDKVRMFLSQSPNILPEQMNALTKR